MGMVTLPLKRLLLTVEQFLQSDAGRHYNITVPNLARSSPILMKAICAFAARHLSNVSDFDPSVAEKFHEQCIRLLIPALSDPDVAADDAVLAALVILRVYEQMTGTSQSLRFGVWV